MAARFPVLAFEMPVDHGGQMSRLTGPSRTLAEALLSRRDGGDPNVPGDSGPHHGSRRRTNGLVTVDVAGVHRTVNVGLIDDGGAGAEVGAGSCPRRLRPLEGRRGGGRRDAAPARGMGAEFEAELEELKGPRDRVSVCRVGAGPLRHLRRRRRADDGPARRRGSRARAVRVGGRRARPYGRDRARRARRLGDSLLVHAGTALVGARMRFVDEFRDPDARPRPGGEILATVQPAATTRSWRSARPHAFDLQVRRRRPAPGNVELVHGPGARCA